MALMEQIGRLEDARGYDPYNHVGRFMKPPMPELRNSVFVMSQKSIVELMRMPEFKPRFDRNPRHAADALKYSMINTGLFGSKIIV